MHLLCLLWSDIMVKHVIRRHCDLFSLVLWVALSVSIEVIVCSLCRFHSKCLQSSVTFGFVLSTVTCSWTTVAYRISHSKHGNEQICFNLAHVLIHRTCCFSGNGLFLKWKNVTDVNTYCFCKWNQFRRVIWSLQRFFCHMLTHKMWWQCESNHKRKWLYHFLTNFKNYCTVAW